MVPWLTINMDSSPGNVFSFEILILAYFQNKAKINPKTKPTNQLKKPKQNKKTQTKKHPPIEHTQSSDPQILLFKQRKGVTQNKMHNTGLFANALTSIWNLSAASCTN